MNSLFCAIRLIRSAWVLAREGVIAALPGEDLSGPAKLAYRLASGLARRQSKKSSRAERLTLALNKLGPSYIKLGQFLGSRPDIVGADISNDLESLQDNVSPFDFEQAKQAIESSLGRSIDDLFVSITPPKAAASIAQVHKATIGVHSSEKNVAVKVIRPGVRRRFKKDLQTFYFAARLAEKFIPDSKRLKPVAIVDTLNHTTMLELDLRMEAAAFSEIKENTKDDPAILIPEVDWERSGRDVVTMSWIDGIKLSDFQAIDKAGIDRKTLAVTLIQTFLRHAIRDGFFHADMHPGNIFVLEDGTLVLIDMGIMGRIGYKERRFLAEILYGFIIRDYRKVSDVHFEAGYVPAHHDPASFAQAIRAIGEPIHGQSAETVSMAKLLTLLFEITQLFDMHTREELILLQKTMVVVEGVARILDPKFNMWKAAEPVVGDWIAKNLGPIGEAKEGLKAAKSAIQLAKRLPELAQQAEQLAQDFQNQPTQHRPVFSKSTTIAIWLIAASMATLAVSHFIG